MAESKKGHNFAIQGPTEKKYVFAYFFVLMLNFSIFHGIRSKVNQVI